MPQEPRGSLEPEREACSWAGQRIFLLGDTELVKVIGNEAAPSDTGHEIFILSPGATQPVPPLRRGAWRCGPQGGPLRAEQPLWALSSPQEAGQGLNLTNPEILLFVPHNSQRKHFFKK